MDWLKQKLFFPPIVPETRKSKIKGADLTPGEGPLPGLCWVGHLLTVCSPGPSSVHMLLQSHGEETTLMTSSNPNHLPKAPSPNTITSGYGFNIWIRGTHTFGPWQVYTQVYMSHSMLRAHTHTRTLHLFPTSVHSEGQGVITPQYQRAKLAPWSWL